MKSDKLETLMTKQQKKAQFFLVTAVHLPSFI